MARSDAAQGKPFNSYPRGPYQASDHGYNNSYGNKGSYQQAYLNGYEAGYRSSYRGGYGRLGRY